MIVIVSFIVAVLIGRALFRTLYKKEAGHSFVRYYTSGAFCVSFILTFALWVFPALLGGLAGNPGSEEKIAASLAVFLFWAIISTSGGFLFGKLKEKLAKNNGF
jgi:hypothetical protein